MPDTGPILSQQVAGIIALIVTAVWAVNFCAAIFVEGYRPPNEVNIAFLGIVGAALGFQYSSGKKGNGS